MNWVDLIFILIIAAVTALAAQRRLPGLVIGFGGVLLFRPLLLLAQISAPVALVLALLLGLGLGFVLRFYGHKWYLGNVTGSLLGGLGGFLLSLTLVLALVTALPIGRDLNNRIVYPPRTLPLGGAAVAHSTFGELGRDILLYPLLERQGLVPPEQRSVLARLHGFFVVGRPWESQQQSREGG